MADFDDLIEHLLNEIAFTGDKGLSAPDFVRVVKAYYDERNAAVIETASAVSGDYLLFSNAPPRHKTLIDDALFNSVFHWLCNNSEVRIEIPGPPFTPDPQAIPANAAAFRIALNGKHLFVSEDRRWQTLTGHGIDGRKIPPMEFRLLSVIGSAGPKGIIQPYAKELADQDKRSVPKRTDILEQKGLIVKYNAIGGGMKTSVLKLKRWATPQNLQLEPLTDPSRPGNPVIYYDLLYDETVRAMRDNNGVIAMKDLHAHLNIVGKRWNIKILLRCLMRLVENGLVRRFRAVRLDRNGLPKYVAGTNRKLSCRCVQLLREPNEQDRIRFRASDDSKCRSEASTEEDEDAPGEIEEPLHVPDLARHSLARNEGRIVVEEEANDEETLAGSRAPIWAPDLPLVNTIHNMIDEAGKDGITSTELRNRLSGPVWRRPIDQSMLLLSSASPQSQPPHLKHLAIVKAYAGENKQTTYQYRTLPNYEKAVQAGDVAEPKSKGKHKVSDKPRNLDEWGFPKVVLNSLASRDGCSTLLEGLRGLSAPSTSTPQRKGGRVSKDQLPRSRRTAEKLDPKETAFGRASSATGEATPVTGTSATIAHRDALAITASTQVADGDIAATREIEQMQDNVLGRAKRIPKRTPKVIDYVSPELDTSEPDPESESEQGAGAEVRAEPGKSNGKHGSYRRYPRSVVPLVKTREIPQSEYDDFDRIAEATAERRVFIEVKASNAGSQTVNATKTTRADLPRERVSSVKDEILSRQKPGIYINPPGARTMKLQSYVQIGRPRKALIAVVKTDRLHELDWYKEDGARRRAPKASRRRTSYAGLFRPQESAEHVEHSYHESEENEISAARPDLLSPERVGAGVPGSNDVGATLRALTEHSAGMPQPGILGDDVAIDMNPEYQIAQVRPSSARAAARHDPVAAQSRASSVPLPTTEQFLLKAQSAVLGTNADVRLAAGGASGEPGDSTIFATAPLETLEDRHGLDGQEDPVPMDTDQAAAKLSMNADSDATKVWDSTAVLPSRDHDKRNSTVVGQNNAAPADIAAIDAQPLTPQQSVQSAKDELRAFSTRMGRKSKATWARIAELNQIIAAGSLPSLPDTSSLMRQHGHPAPNQDPATARGPDIFDKACDPRPEEKLHQRGSGSEHHSIRGSISKAGDISNPSKQTARIVSPSQAAATPPPSRATVAVVSNHADNGVNTPAPFNAEIAEDSSIQTAISSAAGTTYAVPISLAAASQTDKAQGLDFDEALTDLRRSEPAVFPGSKHNAPTTTRPSKDSETAVPLRPMANANLETVRSTYVEQHPDENFYHRGQGRWLRGLPPPGSSVRTAVRGPGAPNWKMAVLGYSIKTSSKSKATSSATTNLQSGSSVSRESLIVKLRIPRPYLARLSDGSMNVAKIDVPASVLAIVRPYSSPCAGLNIVRPYSGSANVTPIPTGPTLMVDTPSLALGAVPLAPRDGPTGSSSFMDQRKTPTRSTSKSGKTSWLKEKYREYPASVTDEEIFAGDPDQLAFTNLFRLAQKYTMKEIVTNVNATRAQPVVNQPNLSNKLSRACSDIAARDGKERDVVMQELRNAQQANGITLNGLRKTPAPLLKSTLQNTVAGPSKSSDPYTLTSRPDPATILTLTSQVSTPHGATALVNNLSTEKRNLGRPAEPDVGPNADNGTAPVHGAGDSFVELDMPIVSSQDIEMLDAPTPSQLQAQCSPRTEPELSNELEQPTEISPLASKSPLAAPTSTDGNPKPTIINGKGKDRVQIRKEREEIIMNAIRASNGAFPGDGQLWNVICTVWKRRYAGPQPDKHTVDRIIKDLVQSNKLKKLLVKFKRNGRDIAKSILTQPDIEPSSDVVTALNKATVSSYPHPYFPPEADIDEDMRKRSMRRHAGRKNDLNSEDARAVALAHNRPEPIIGVPQTQQAAQLELKEAHKQGFETVEEYQSHRELMVHKKKAKNLQRYKDKRAAELQEEIDSENGEEADGYAGSVDRHRGVFGTIPVEDYQHMPDANSRTRNANGEFGYMMELNGSNEPRRRQDRWRDTRQARRPKAPRRKLESIDAVGKKTRRPRDVDGNMTLDDEVRQRRRAGALMIHPEQKLHEPSGTIGTQAIITNEAIVKGRQLRPRNSVVQDLVPHSLDSIEEEYASLDREPRQPSLLDDNMLAEGRLVEEFGVPEDYPADPSDGLVHNLRDVLKYASSLELETTQARLAAPELKANQFLDELDAVQRWEERLEHNSNAPRPASQAFINHTLNQAQTRLVRIQPSSVAIRTSATDPNAAPTLLVKLKVPNLSTVKTSARTLKPTRKYKPRKRLIEEVGVGADDSDEDFVPAAMRDSALPAVRARGPPHKKAKLGLGVKRDMKSGPDFKDADRLVVAMALVAVVCGGINQDRPNWNLIAHALRYRYDGEFLRRRWVHLRRSRKEDVNQFRDALREPFLAAYEEDELPCIDFQDLINTDWPDLFDWAEEVLEPMKTLKRKDESAADVELLESRAITEEAFRIVEPQSVFELSQEDFFANPGDTHRKHLVVRYMHGVTLPDKTKPTNVSNNRPTLLKSWIRAVALTKAWNYNQDLAAHKLRSIADPKTLGRVSAEMVDNRVLNQEKKGRHLPGRNFHIHDDVLKQFRRWPSKSQEHRFLRLVAQAWSNISKHFDENTDLALIPAASDPEYLVLTNMLAQGIVRSTVQLPEVNWDYDAPLPRLSPWGYAKGYETKKVKIPDLRFPIVYTRTAAWTFEGHGLKSGVPIPMQPAPVPAEDGVRIPLWVDIHGNLIDDVWDMTLRSVIHLLVFRPGSTAQAMAKAHSDKLWPWEIELVLQWAEQVGIADRCGAGKGVVGGWKAGSWWYCAFSPDIAVWNAPS